ncbi:MAG: CPBP family intramembrane metalloprotease [Bacteroidaceae bacterium]|nr:CPBP family intramembrane metalloprotease [Bacteroidaceae bacterium]
MKNVYLKVVLALVIFLVMQGLGGLLVVVVSGVINHYSAGEMANGAQASPTLLALAVIISGLLSCLILWGMKMIRLPKALDCSVVRWCPALLGILAAVVGIFSTDMASEMLNLPDMMEDVFMDLAKNVWGILGIAIVGPIVEELVFREGIQGSLERSGKPFWLAAVVSALCFGLIHLNPAQVPFAFVMGLILSVIYHKTGNAVVTSIIHILNNSIAVLQMNLLGEKAADFKMGEWMGLTPVCEWALVAVLAVLCVYILYRYWQLETVKTKNDEVPE